ncbi:MAG: cobalamin B12-binding domain-containing protein [Paracoccaceae bacterium]
MYDQSEKAVRQTATKTPARKTYEILAAEVLARVSPGAGDSADIAYNRDVALLSDAALHEDPGARQRVIADIVQRGSSPSQFISSYASDAARHLGYLWETNQISFAEVTIGVARLQEAVRRMAARKVVFDDGKPRPEILLVVPKEEDHVFGIFVAAETFERLGCYVHLALGKTAEQITEHALMHPFDMIGISISSRRTVKAATRVIERLHKDIHRVTPIVIGGGIVGLEPDIAKISGADHATTDPAEALQLCAIENITITVA